MSAPQRLHGTTPALGGAVLAGMACLMFYRASLSWNGKGTIQNRWRGARSAAIGTAMMIAAYLMIPGAENLDRLAPIAEFPLVLALFSLPLEVWFRRRRPPPVASAPRLDGVPALGPPVDPGWSEVLATVSDVMMLPWLQVPPIGRRRERRMATLLTQLRTVYLAFLFSLFLFAFVLSFIAPWDGGDERWIPLFIAGFGVYGLAIASWFGRRPYIYAKRGMPPVAPADLAQLAAVYRTRMFLGIALVQAVALMGFVGVFIGGSLWLYCLGLALSLFGHWRVAPSRRNIERDQERLREQGISLDLTTALMTQPAVLPA
jgi:hypothetical protein